MNRALFGEGSERFNENRSHSYSNIVSPNESNTRRAALPVTLPLPTLSAVQAAPAILERMRRFSLNHADSYDRETVTMSNANASRRRLKKVATNVTMGPSSSTVTTAVTSSGGHYHTPHVTINNTLHTSSSNGTMETLTGDDASNQVLLTGEKIHPSRWTTSIAVVSPDDRPVPPDDLFDNAAYRSSTLHSTKKQSNNVQHGKEFPILSSNSHSKSSVGDGGPPSTPASRKTPLVRSRSNDRDVIHGHHNNTTIPTVPITQYERARRRSSYSGCFPSRMDSVDDAPPPDDSHGQDFGQSSNFSSAAAAAQPSRVEWERNRSSKSPTRTRGSMNEDSGNNATAGTSWSRHAPRRTMTPPTVPPATAAAFKVATPTGRRSSMGGAVPSPGTAAGRGASANVVSLKPKSSSMHAMTPTSSRLRFQADFAQFSQLNSSGIISTHSNSSSHDSFGSLGDNTDGHNVATTTAVPSTPMTDSRTKVLTLSARDTPSRRLKHSTSSSSPRGITNSPESPPSMPPPPLPPSKNSDTGWIVRSSPRGFARTKSNPAPDYETEEELYRQYQRHHRDRSDSPNAAAVGAGTPNMSATSATSRHRRVRSGTVGVARAKSADRMDRPMRPPLSANSSSSSLDEPRNGTARRNRRNQPLKTRTALHAAAVALAEQEAAAAAAAASVRERDAARPHNRNDERQIATTTTTITAKPSKRAPKPKSEYLNHSFNLSMSDDMCLIEPDSPDGHKYEHEIATPAIVPSNKKLSAHHVPNFAIPQSPVKATRRSAAKQQQQLGMAAIASVAEEAGGGGGSGGIGDEDNDAIDDLLDLEQEEMLEDALTEADEPVVKTGKELYEYARRCAWDMVAEECLHNPWTAKYVCDLDGTTALHLAVISRANPVMRDGTLGESFQPAPLALIEQLIVACPEAAIIRCAAKRYTPLSYASLVADTGYDMDDSAAMIQIIMKHNPHSALVYTDDGFSAVDVHIISYSRLHQEKAEVYSPAGRSSTVVLRALLDADPSLALVRSYGCRVRGPVELLYRCNLKEFKEATGADIVQSERTATTSTTSATASTNRGRSKKSSHACSSVMSTLSDWWAWKWALLLLKVSSLLEDDDDNDNHTLTLAAPTTPFSAVHAASHLVGCPIPVLALAIDAFPELARTRNPRPSRWHNCPLHEVCSWVTDDLVMNGDPFVVKRKRKAIAMLLEAFAKAARMTNSLGETPLQLAIETCTPWDSLEKLVKAFPKALLLPRSMEHFQEDSPLSKAVAYHNDDVGSVGSNEEEWESDAIDAVEGMYPFMVAGVLSHIPERRNYAETLLTGSSDQLNDKGELAKSVRLKDLESLRSIYGLLRAQPSALASFLQDEANRRVEEARKLAELAAKAQEQDVDGSLSVEEETCTEAYVEDHSYGVKAAAAILEDDNVSYDVEEIVEDESCYYTEEDVVDDEDDEVDDEDLDEEEESATSDYTEIEEVSHI